MALTVVLILANCSTNNIPIPKTIWPELPDVPEVPKLDLKSVDFSIPTAKSFVGLDYNNWLNYQYNLQIIGLEINVYKQRLTQINSQRADWRKLNGANKNASSDPVK